MPILHMETDEVLAVSHLLHEFSGTVAEQSQALTGTAEAFAVEWEGAGRADFEARLMEVGRQTGLLIETANELAQRVQREVEEWQMVDGAGTFEPGRSLLLAQGADYTSEAGFDWRDAADNTIPFAVETGLEKIAALWTFEQYRAFGRFINRSLLDNARGGWVGRMDRLGHFVESPWIQQGVPLGVSVFLDEDWGVDTGRAIAGEVIAKGIETGVAWIIPGFGQVMLASGVIQFAGTLAAGGLEGMGYSGQAAWLQNNLELIDLGRYTEDLAEAVYDVADNWLRNPENLSEDLHSVATYLDRFDLGFLAF